MTLFDLSFLRELLYPKGLMDDVPRGEPEVYQRTYRFLCVLMALLVPAFGLLYHWTSPAAFDPLWLRLLMGALFFAPVPLSQVSRRVRSHLRVILQGAFYVVVVYITVLAVVSGFLPGYAVGLLFTAAAASIGFSLTVWRQAPLVGYLVFTSVFTSGAAFATPPSAPFNAALFSACVTSAMLVVLLATQLRLYALNRSQEHEKRFRQLMEGANDAIFVMDAESGRIVDANCRAQQMTERSLEELRGEHQHILHPEEERLEGAEREALGRKITEEGVVTVEGHVVNRSGERTPVEASITVMELEERPLSMGIFRDVTARREYEQQLIESKEHAEEALRLKSDILNNMSHEIRTPLTSILGFAEALHEELEGEEQDFVHIINENAQRLQQTLDSVLDMAQLERGEMMFETAPLDVAEETRDGLAALRPLAENKGLSLRLRTPGDGAAIASLDAPALHRILNNLVGNAIKFTEHGAVTVTVEAGAEAVRLHVEDTGAGISEDFLPHLFEAFKQQSRGLSRHYEGSGLGLAITQRLVHLMDGTIGVESEEGVGTTFTVSFPRRRGAGNGTPHEDDTREDRDGAARMPSSPGPSQPLSESA